MTYLQFLRGADLSGSPKHPRLIAGEPQAERGGGMSLPQADEGSRQVRTPKKLKVRHDD